MKYINNYDEIIHLHFNFDACPMHSSVGFVYLTHQNLTVCALFCHNSLATVNMQLLIYYYCCSGECLYLLKTFNLVHVYMKQKATLFKQIWYQTVTPTTTSHYLHRHHAEGAVCVLYNFAFYTWFDFKPGVFQLMVAFIVCIALNSMYM